MSYLIDTNVISELHKGVRCDPNVLRWKSGVADDDLYVSVLVLGEIRKGVEKVRPHDPERARNLERWLSGFDGTFSDRVLPLTAEIADEWGRMSARRSVPVVDCLQAATAKAHGLTIVTRNMSDFDGLDIMVLDPFVA